MNHYYMYDNFDLKLSSLEYAIAMSLFLGVTIALTYTTLTILSCVVNFVRNFFSAVHREYKFYRKNLLNISTSLRKLSELGSELNKKLNTFKKILDHSRKVIESIKTTGSIKKIEYDDLFSLSNILTFLTIVTPLIKKLVTPSASSASTTRPPSVILPSAINSKYEDQFEKIFNRNQSKQEHDSFDRNQTEKSTNLPQKPPLPTNIASAKTMDDMIKTLLPMIFDLSTSAKDVGTTSDKTEVSLPSGIFFEGTTSVLSEVSLPSGIFLEGASIGAADKLMTDLFKDILKPKNSMTELHAQLPKDIHIEFVPATYPVQQSDTELNIEPVTPRVPTNPTNTPTNIDFHETESVFSDSEDSIESVE